MRAARNPIVVIFVLAVAGAADARAQVVRPPVAGGAINAAKRGVEKTNEQTQAAEKEGGAPQKAAAPQKQAPAATQKAAPAPQKAGAKTGAKAGARADTGTGAVAQAGSRRNQVQIFREQFSYSEAGRRDPFVSLMATGELRPVFSDLVLTGVLHDRDPRKSLAMLVDVSSGESYRVRVGQPLGRMRISRIGLEDIAFTIDEFGLSRTETLVIDRTRKAGPAPARRP